MPGIDHQKMYHSFGSTHSHSQLDITNSWTEAMYLSKYCNPAIRRVDEMERSDTSQVNLDYYKNEDISEKIQMDSVMQCEANIY